MKPKQLARNIFILAIWSWIYFYWLRYFLFRNWNFDFVWAPDWQYIRDQWVSGWVIAYYSDWAFIFTLFIALPIWMIGFLRLIAVDWGKPWKWIVQKIKAVLFAKGKKNSPAVPQFFKKKSHTQTRPPALQIGGAQGVQMPTVEPPKKEPEPDFSFKKSDFTQESIPRSELLPAKQPENSMQSIDNFWEHSSTSNDHLPIEPQAPLSAFPAISDNEPKKDEETPLEKSDVADKSVSYLESKGYTVVRDLLVEGQRLDFAAISEKEILLFKLDNEKGDWLADEEQFNEDDPLWFSESSHRTSPVFELKNMRDALKDKLPDTELTPVLMIYRGEIINGEDMEDTWKELNVRVVKATGCPSDELKGLEEVYTDSVTPSSESDKIEALLRG